MLQRHDVTFIWSISVLYVENSVPMLFSPVACKPRKVIRHTTYFDICKTNLDLQISFLNAARCQFWFCPVPCHGQFHRIKTASKLKAVSFLNISAHGARRFIKCKNWYKSCFSFCTWRFLSRSRMLHNFQYQKMTHLIPCRDVGQWPHCSGGNRLYH